MIAPFAGLIAGMAHALSGPDHLAAVTPLAITHRRDRWRIGIQWGLGHALSVAVVGALALTTRELLPWDLISTVSERLVGVALIGMGIWGVRAAFRHRLHSHPHKHETVCHEHVHVHSAASDVARLRGHSHGHSAFGIGALHGIAGGSHMLAAIAALAFSSAGQAILYLAAYAAGTVTAMALFCGTVSHLLFKTEDDRERRLPVALGISSLAALICGGFWLAG